MADPKVYIYRNFNPAPKNTSSNILARKIPITEFLTSLKPHVPIPDNSIVLNYGYSKSPRWNKSNVRLINDPEDIMESVSKVRMYKKFEEWNIPCFDWRLNKDTIDWQEPTMVRCKIDSHSGQGIKVIPFGEKIPDADLYTRFLPIEKEQRFFICGNEIVSIIEKGPMPEEELKRWKIKGVDEWVRCFRKGWRYVDENIVTTKKIRELALRTAYVFKMKFCAVDIAISKDNPNDIRVIEINTEPGLAHVSEKTLVELAAGVNKFVKSLQDGSYVPSLRVAFWAHAKKILNHLVY